MKTKHKFGIAILIIGAVIAKTFAQESSASAGSAVKTTFNDAAKALSNKQIGDFFPMYDTQVNQILRMCNKGGNLVGSINALVSLGVYLGNEIDPEEEEVLIRGSKTDVALYDQIAKSIIGNLKKPANTSISEASAIIEQIEKGNGQDIQKGITTLSSASYRLRTGHELLINREKLELWASVGKIEQPKFMELYTAMQQVGMEKELNETNTRAIIDLVKENSNADILQAVNSLKMAQWRCEGELNHREVGIISNVIHNKFTEDTNTAINQNPSQQVKPQEVLSEKRASIEQ